VGKRIPEAPEQTLVLRVRFSDPELLDVLLQGRYVGQRFGDDTNTLSLGSLAVADLTVSRRLTASTSVFLGVENLFDREYEAQRDSAGLVQVERRLAHVGVRFRSR
jgi:outer membrane cobalamin receptor